MHPGDDYINSLVNNAQNVQQRRIHIGHKKMPVKRLQAFSCMCHMLLLIGHCAGLEVDYVMESGRIVSRLLAGVLSENQNADKSA